MELTGDMKNILLIELPEPHIKLRFRLEIGNLKIYTSVFKTSFNNALQNFELIRAAMADSFVSFEKSVENMSQFSSVQKK